jgi:hypothetical protein
MKTIQNILAATFGVLFIITAILALFFFNMDRRAFRAEVYQQVFANEGFYNRLPTVLAEALATATSGQSGFPLVIQGLTAQNWETFLRAILPQETLKQMGDEALASVFAYVNIQSDTAQLSLKPLKENLASNLGVQAVYTLLSSQPDCTLAQITDMTLFALQQGQIQICKPSQELYNMLAPVVQIQLQVTASLLPDQITVASVENQPGQIDPRERLMLIRQGMRLSPILPLGLLFVITILVVRTLKSWLFWWGLPFTIAGSTAALIGLVGSPITRVILQGILVNNLPAYLPAIMLDYAGELSAAMINELLNPVIGQGLLLAFLGLVMILLGLLIPHRQALVSATRKKTFDDFWKGF